MAVSLKPEEIFEIGGISVTNSMITAVIIAFLMILFFVVYTGKLSVRPHSKLQLFIESTVISLYDLSKGIMGEKATRSFFPFIFTFFTLILISNWFGLMPFVGSVGYTHPAKEAGSATPILVLGNNAGHSESSEEKYNSNKESENEEDLAPAPENNNTTLPENEDANYATSEQMVAASTAENAVRISRNEEIHKPLLRSPSADLNFTLAMAIISFLLIQYAGLKSLGFEYLGKFFDLRVSIPKGWKIIFLPFTFFLNIFWKLLELVLELGKIISFTFRLFGNIFAGEVLLFVMTSLTFGIATLPFMGLEIFVGFVQAIVFIFLTMVFIKVASESHHGEAHHDDANVA